MLISCLVKSFAPFPLQKYHRYYDFIRHYQTLFYFGLVVFLLVPFRFSSFDSLHSSINKPMCKSCRLYAECRCWWCFQVTPALVPRQIKFPRFPALSVSISTSHRSVHFRSTLTQTLERFLSTSLFPVRSIPSPLRESTAG